MSAESCKQRIIIRREGELRVNEIEGGFAPCEFTVDTIDLESLIGEALGKKCTGRGGYDFGESGVLLGQCVLTLEIIPA